MFTFERYLTESEDAVFDMKRKAMLLDCETFDTLNGFVDMKDIVTIQTSAGTWQLDPEQSQRFRDKCQRDSEKYQITILQSVASNAYRTTLSKGVLKND